MLGLTPQLGRLLNPDDDREPGSGRVAVLSYDYWRRRFGERADVMGQSILVNGQALAIVGVAPRGFHGTTRWPAPVILRADLDARGRSSRDGKGSTDRRSYWAYLFARLKPGIDIEPARATFNAQYPH